ncbi:MAG: small multi-drug export protein [Desulfobacter sp.]|nr:small multi-drug export protein [Desulfobacter sp.]WDP85141.1 MAG: small multi-drug export protein [Desulfobacter sp.]
MKHILYHTTEGRILIFGVFLAFTFIALVGGVSAVDFSLAKILVLVILAHLVGSRAGGIGLCIINGFDPLTTISYNFYIETLIVCFTYSGFVLSTTNYLKVEWIKRFMNKLANKAMEKKEKIKRWGWIGIFSFVMAPLPVTGPVIGSIIGYMLKMRLVSNFTATALGTLTATIIWCYGFEFLEQRFQMVQYLFAAICVMVLIPYLKPIKKFIISCTKEDPES